MFTLSSSSGGAVASSGLDASVDGGVPVIPRSGAPASGAFGCRWLPVGEWGPVGGRVSTRPRLGSDPKCPRLIGKESPLTHERLYLRDSFGALGEEDLFGTANVQGYGCDRSRQ